MAVETTTKNANDLYRSKKTLCPSDIFSPPAERRPHVMRFELTTGCDWQRCTYCQGYNGIRPHTKTLDEYKAHVDLVWKKYLGLDPDGVKFPGRVFIGGGNALAVDTEMLAEAIAYTIKRFDMNTRYWSENYPDRTAIYGRTDSINEKGTDDLRRLQDVHDGQGLDLVYWGIESGSTAVLRYVQKGHIKEEILQAGRELHDGDMLASVMIMPGLGGMKFYDRHVRDTADVLCEVQPRYITFMCVNTYPNSKYAERMHDEESRGENRPLTDKELIVQMSDIISLMADSPFKTKIGCHGGDVDAVGRNPISFNRKIEWPEDVHKLAEDLICSASSYC